MNLTPSGSSATSRLAVRYIDDTLLLSDTHAWTYLRVPTVSYEFTSYADRQALAARIQLALGALVTGTDPVDVHLLVTSRPVDERSWAADLDARVAPQRPAPGWSAHVAKVTEYLGRAGYRRKENYLGVCLGPRRGKGGFAPASFDLLSPVKKALRRTEAALGLEDDQIAPAELAHFATKAKAVHRTLATGLQATPATANQMAWLVTKPLFPAMPCPSPSASPNRVWGRGEVQALAEGEITKGHKRLQITQTHPDTFTPMTGWTTTVCLSRFPDVLLFPDQEPWMHWVASLGFPVDLSSRLTLVPATTVQKDIGKRLSQAKDQATHIAEAGGAVPLDIQEQFSMATALEFAIAKDRQPWAYGRHRLAITAPTEEILQARVRAVAEHYRELGIDVIAPSGDQIDLLFEAQPGDKVRALAYYQRQELLTIAGGMPTASSEVGNLASTDPRGGVGFYLGETTSRVRSMVTFNPHAAPARNRPSVFAITGAPGGGKSFLAFTLALEMALSGVWTIYLDPKADAKPMGTIPGLGTPRVFDLREGNDGMIDPFSLAETTSEATLLAMETLRLLLGGQISEEREEALLNAIAQVAAAPAPSLGKVIDVLLASPVTGARNLGKVLDTMRGLPFARLCFAPSQGQTMRPEDGLTIITLLGLDLPTASTKPADYSYENRLAVSVMYLLTRYARRLMLGMNKSHPKALIIDEAWAVTSTPQGAKLVPEIARMGRSHNTALGLVSQNAGDLMDSQVKNAISAVFAFRSTDPDEITDILTLLRAEVNEGHRESVRMLNNGECLFMDVEGRIARVQVDAWNAETFDKFDSNPETRGKRTAAAGAQADGATR